MREQTSKMIYFRFAGERITFLFVWGGEFVICDPSTTLFSDTPKRTCEWFPASSHLSIGDLFRQFSLSFFLPTYL